MEHKTMKGIQFYEPEFTPEDINNDFLKVCRPQWFNPIYNDYSDSNDMIPKTKYIVRNIDNVITEDVEEDTEQYIKNFAQITVINVHTKKEQSRDSFIKFVPIIDPIFFSIRENKTYDWMLPCDFMHENINKVNNSNNKAYIDSFFSILGSKLVEGGRCPTFPLFYGTYSGIKDDYMFDITEEYSQIRYNNNFQKNKKAMLFELHQRECRESLSEDDSISICDSIELFENSNLISDDIQELDDVIKNSELFNDCIEPTNDEMDNELDEIISIDNNYEFDDLLKKEDTFKYLKLKNFPVQCVFLEKLEGTLESILDSQKHIDLDETEWLAYLFQIIFGLCVAQKQYNFTHNDLHCENIMYTKTETEFIYYEFDKKIFKIPTYGKILKIIDFGRAIYNYNNLLYFSDDFDENGDAEGQYSYTEGNSLKGLKHKPNPSFDLARLSSTILTNFDNNTGIFKLLKGWLTDRYGYCLINEPDEFDIYIKIARTIHNAVPKNQLKKNIFKRFIINKNEIESTTYVYRY